MSTNGNQIQKYRKILEEKNAKRNKQISKKSTAIKYRIGH